MPTTIAAAQPTHFARGMMLAKKLGLDLDRFRRKPEPPSRLQRGVQLMKKFNGFAGTTEPRLPKLVFG